MLQIKLLRQGPQGLVIFLKHVTIAKKSLQMPHIFVAHQSTAAYYDSSRLSNIRLPLTPLIT